MYQMCNNAGILHVREEVTLARMRNNKVMLYIYIYIRRKNNLTLLYIYNKRTFHIYEMCLYLPYKCIYVYVCIYVYICIYIRIYVMGFCEMDEHSLLNLLY